MEKNLTTLFGMVDSFIDRYNAFVVAPNRPLEGTLVAVGRESMLAHYPQVQDLAMYNWKVLNERSISYVNGSYTLQRRDYLSTGRSKKQPHNQKSPLPVFECGEGWVEEAFYKHPGNRDKIPNNYYGSIVPSIINFWLAVQADVFVGVMKSSWSTDVWTTRYYQGKGRKNFQYTKDSGIIPVANGGLPPSHRSC